MSDIIIKPTDAIENGSLLQVIQKNLPILQRANTNAVAAMKQIEAISSDEQVDSAKELLVQVKNTYDKMIVLRKAVTDPVDALKDFMMDFERALDYGTGKKSEYNRVKLLITGFENEKIKRNKEAEEQARQQKLKEQALVDMKAKIKLNITDVIIGLCRRVESNSKDYFDVPKTLEEFDKAAERYKGTKWKLKGEDYDKCFAVSFPAGISMTNEEKDEFMINLKIEVKYDQVNELYMEKANPLFTNWISKIPQLRDNLAQMLKAGEEERARLKAANDEKAAAEAKRSAEYLAQQQDTMQRNVEVENSLGKMEADFKEQGTLQNTLEDVGPKKKVLRFDGDQPVATLCEVIYQVFLNKNFKGIYKLDKDKKQVLDDNGRPEYDDAIQFWLNQMQKLKINTEIKGLRVEEDAKVIVRK